MIAINRIASSENQQLVTFRCGNLLLGLEISNVQEINRQTDVTVIPEAPPHVRGAINLRGDVVTVIDLATILGLASDFDCRSGRNVIVRSNGELIGLMADGVSDIIDVTESQIEPTPSNIEGVESRYFSGVFSSENELVVILNLDEIVDIE